MSRFGIISATGRKYVYGWDRQLEEYFMTSETLRGFRSYVGGESSMAGTGANLWKAMLRHQIIPPMRHAREMRYDLPLSESGELPDDPFDVLRSTVSRSLASPTKVESRLYGIVISADGVQAVDFIEGNTIVVKGPLEE